MGVSLVLDGRGKGGSDAPGTRSQVKIQTEVQAESEAGDQAIVQPGDKTAPGQASRSPSGESFPPAPESGVGGELNTGSGESKLTCQAAIHVGPLRGPISMGLISLIDGASKDETSNIYEFIIAGKADELVGKIAGGDLNIAPVPTNIASMLYAKTQGDITILDINTLGVLCVVALDDSITSMANLEERTIYTAGKGTTSEYVMNYLLEENGLSASDVDLQFKSRVTEVASLLKQDSSAIGVLPQPPTTAACIQNPGLRTVLDLTGQWDILNKNSRGMLATGIILIRDDFLRENRSPVTSFIKNHGVFTLFAKEYTEDVVQLIAKQDIVEEAPIAQKVLPYYNIMHLTGQEIENVLSGYLSTLNEQGPKSIDGQMLGDDFYYMS